MTTRELYLWFLGMQDCARGMEPRSNREWYLQGYGDKYQLEQMESAA
jgi:hypothetical protein